jgi:hypothetical protein
LDVLPTHDVPVPKTYESWEKGEGKPAAQSQSSPPTRSTDWYERPAGAKNDWNQWWESPEADEGKGGAALSAPKPPSFKGKQVYEESGPKGGVKGDATKGARYGARGDWETTYDTSAPAPANDWKKSGKVMFEGDEKPGSVAMPQPPHTIGVIPVQTPQILGKTGKPFDEHGKNGKYGGKAAATVKPQGQGVSPTPPAHLGKSKFSADISSKGKRKG